MAGESQWTPLGGVRPTDLGPARDRLHGALQWLARIARSYLPAKEDDSHTAMEWDAATKSFQIAPLAGEAPVRASFSPEAFQVNFARGDERWSKSLDRLGEDAREAAIVAGLEAVGLNPAELSLEMPYALPSSDAAAADPDHAVEIAAYFENFSDVLGRLAQLMPNAGPVRVWPHHFDVAALIAIDDEGGEDARSINCGLSPGDESYGEPYLYVTPWPVNDVEALGGAPEDWRWHREGFTALIATASERREDLSDSRGDERVLESYRRAVDTCRDVLGA